MPKPRRGKLLGGSSSNEDQIIGNFFASLIEFEKIETTLTKAKGPGEVKAAQIQCPAGVEVVNTDLKTVSYTHLTLPTTSPV